MLSAPHSVKSAMPTLSTPWHLCWGMASMYSVPKTFAILPVFLICSVTPPQLSCISSLTQETLTPHALSVWDPWNISFWHSTFPGRGLNRWVNTSLSLPRQLCFYLRQLVVLINKPPKQDVNNASRGACLNSAYGLTWHKNSASSPALASSSPPILFN